MMRTLNMLSGKWEDGHTSAQPDSHQETLCISEYESPLPMLQLREIEAQTDKTISLADLNTLINSLEG